MNNELVIVPEPLMVNEDVEDPFIPLPKEEVVGKLIGPLSVNSVPLMSIIPFGKSVVPDTIRLFPSVSVDVVLVKLNTPNDLDPVLLWLINMLLVIEPVPPIAKEEVVEPINTPLLVLAGKVIALLSVNDFPLRSRLPSVKIAACAIRSFPKVTVDPDLLSVNAEVLELEEV